MRQLVAILCLATAACVSRATPASPVRPLASYVSSDDYPAGTDRRQEGRTAFVLEVDTDGRVGACRIVESSGSASLDQAACRVMRSRARFTPARNARGVAVPGQYRASILWRLPVE